ncbi:hypothetical protein RDV84_09895 [Lysobacter yananisis]|uniref:Uncharacterized protein n=1 Tax=Lysobacter yananisis TaxID=1003114 RepID=A0ABY9PE15_9GAMM|nr:hypothetical protein [Lysobacter yananisis]WMT05131.1 hypothetical protein RDV84_09895 [Lysobacter yananisis]
MDENLHYLLHQELDGLFDRPSAGAGTGDGAPSPAAFATQAEPSAAVAAQPDRDADDGAGPAFEPTRAERLRDPKLLQALVRLLGLHA